MLRSGKWKLLKNWIEFVKNTGSENPYLFESNISFESEIKASEATFYIIDLYLIKKYKGYITEKGGILNIKGRQLLEQYFYNNVTLTPVIGTERNNEPTNPIQVIKENLDENEVYIIDGIKKENVLYFLEKDEDGLYSQNLETIHYFKIKKQKVLEKKIEASINLFNICY